MKWTYRTFLREQCSSLDPVLHADLTGKSVVVIGANVGIGFEAAKHFARMNPSRLILACRSEQKGAAAVKDIEKTTGYCPELRLVDLADFSSVVDFAAKLDGEPIDILVANAGIIQDDYKVTKDGWEEILQVNHLSTALLSFLLLPNMRKASIDHGSTSRLVIVTSELHHLAKFDEQQFAGAGLLHNLNKKEDCTPKVMRTRYPDTKLLNVLFTRAFAEHLATPGQVIATSVNPGYCASTILRNMGWADTIRGTLMSWTIGRTSEQGARQLIWAALGPDGKEGPHLTQMNGAYVSCAGIHESSDFVMSREGYSAQEKAWAETIDVLSKVTPLVGEIAGRR